MNYHTTSRWVLDIGHVSRVTRDDDCIVDKACSISAPLNYKLEMTNRLTSIIVESSGCVISGLNLLKPGWVSIFWAHHSTWAESNALDSLFLDGWWLVRAKSTINALPQEQMKGCGSIIWRGHLKPSQALQKCKFEHTDEDLRCDVCFQLWLHPSHTCSPQPQSTAVKAAVVERGEPGNNMSRSESRRGMCGESRPSLILSNNL